MKRIIPLLFLLVFYGISFAQVDKDSDYLVYRDDKYPFSLFYPNDWKQVEPSHPQTRFKILSGYGLGLKLTDFSVIVIYSKEAESMSSSAFVKNLNINPKLVEAIVKTGAPDAKIISSGETYLNNKEAFFLKYEATYKNLDKSYDLIIYQLLMLYEGNSYTLTFRALKDEFDEDFPTFQYIASTFVIRPTKIVIPQKKQTNTKRTKKRGK